MSTLLVKMGKQNFGWNLLWREIVKSHNLGKNISAPEVVNISLHGIWLDVGGLNISCPIRNIPGFGMQPSRKSKM